MKVTDVNPVSTPYKANTQLMKNMDDNIISIDQSRDVQIIGSVMPLMNYTRRNIAYAVCRLTRYT